MMMMMMMMMDAGDDVKDCGTNGHVPFPALYELTHFDAGQDDHLPGHPRVSLLNPDDTKAFLCRDLFAHDLEELAPKLWVMFTPSGANISPLHRQIVKDRKIVITEEPGLHLVWIHNRMFIKPLPKYLLAWQFWQDYLLDESSSLGESRKAVYSAALGLLRPYYYLIIHESDFEIACDQRLLPRRITWPQFCNFSARFNHISDSVVSTRYTFGELRLTRLNFYTKIFLRRWQYEWMVGQYATYFSRFHGPVLFTFAIWSVVLNAMQVELAAGGFPSDQRTAFRDTCRWFSVLTVACACILALFFTLLLFGMVIDEWVYALKYRYRRTKDRRG